MISLARRFSLMRLAMLAISIPLLTSGAMGQDVYPSRPIQIVVPFPPGGVADVVARAVTPALERILKQPMVIVNKAGAAGAVGMQFAATSKPDGYTLMVALVSISTIPEVDQLFGRTPAYSREQFAPIARLSADPPILVVRSSAPWKTVGDLIADAKRRPREIVFSSSGLYGASHVPMEIFMHAAGIKMRHLPTTGGAPAMTAVLGGHAAMWASPPALAFSHIKAGSLRVLANFGGQRLAALPEIPTLKELGYNVEYYLWAGLFAPRDTPATVLRLLRGAARQAVDDPGFKSAMTKVETPVAYLDADEFQKFWDEDAKMLSEAIRRVGKVE